ncbi:NAD-dependent epimerase/dehydratase family protein [Archaeoglobus neptunius]|uniref:NAD-dependent epimerase/dehydratase family protein n=1 Tax=Archaeoglobus neptunius TaxID=2798580 RepID=UPI001928B926|nr:NAD(P)-dependent oxidoreductase [Archaeoglobus neptunius]
MAVLITGGSGFLGRFIAERFREVVILDLKRPKKGVFEFGSVTSWPDIVRVFKNHDIEGVVHAAAELSVKAEKSHADTFRTNVEGTLNVLEACRLFDVEKIVFTSSHSVYGPKSQQPLNEYSFRDPTTFYGATKACSEIVGCYYNYTYGLDFRAVRFPILIGPFRGGMGASVTFSSFIDDVFFGRSPVIRLPPETRLPVLYVRDAADFIVKFYEKNIVSSPLFNAGGIALSIEQMVRAVKNFYPEFEPVYDYGEEEKRIAETWTFMTLMAEKSGILDRYRKNEELGWEIRWDSPEKIVRDHLKTLEVGV